MAIGFLYQKKNNIFNTILMKKEKKDVQPQITRSRALMKLAAYLTKHHLDPDKDWSKDPKHGKIISKYYKIIKISEEQILKEKRKLMKPEVHIKREKAESMMPKKYNYPLIDGKPMSPNQKKKYRSKMRALLKAKVDIKKAEAKALKYATNLEQEN